MQKFSTIDQFLASLPADKKEQVQLLRAIIAATHPGLEEHIKWNAPSFMLDGDDRITFNLLNKENAVKLVLHMGVGRKENKAGAPVMAEDSGLVSWQSDIRGVLMFAGAADIESKREAVASIISRWLAIIP